MKNNNLKPVQLPMDQKWGKKPETQFVNNLDAINVEIVAGPTYDDITSYIPQFVNATWSDDPYIDWQNKESNGESNKHIELYELIKGKRLPTALETIKFTFLVEGISLQEVTHILRHRMASFSAECSGDKWWTDKRALVPNSIENSNGFYEDKENDDWGPLKDVSKDFYNRYKNIVRDCKQLYCDMIDSKQVSIMDARYILPRCLETYYFMSMDLGNCIHFIKQRIDKQIQPETDNVIAYQMLDQLCEIIPQLALVIDIHQPSMYYINTARTGKATNLYHPDQDSDIDSFEWNENDFIYNCTRDKLNGTDKNATNKFNKILHDFTVKMETHKIDAKALIGE